MPLTASLPHPIAERVPSGHGGVEKPLEPAVLIVVAAQLADPLEAIGVAAKDQKYRRISDPRHVGHQGREAIAAAGGP
jgi:hypothetical protein